MNIPGAATKMTGAILDELKDVVDSEEAQKAIENIEASSAAILKAVESGNGEREALARDQLKASLHQASNVSQGAIERRLSPMLNVSSAVLRGLMSMGLAAVICSCSSLGLTTSAAPQGQVTASEVRPLLYRVLDDYELYFENDDSLDVPGTAINKQDKRLSVKILRDIFQETTSDGEAEKEDQ